VLEQLFGGVGRGIGRQLSQPKERAFWGGWAVGVVLCGRRAPFLASIVIPLATGFAAQKAWEASEHLAELAAAARPEPIEVPRGAD
jgi:hypothetical protein